MVGRRKKKEALGDKVTILKVTRRTLNVQAFVIWHYERARINLPCN